MPLLYDDWRKHDREQSKFRASIGFYIGLDTNGGSDATLGWADLWLWGRVAKSSLGPVAYAVCEESFHGVCSSLLCLSPSLLNHSYLFLVILERQILL